MSANSETYGVSVAVTPDDNTEQRFKAFLVTVAGNVAITDCRGNVTTIPVNANTVYPISCKKIMSTNTTATGIIGFN